MIHDLLDYVKVILLRKVLENSVKSQKACIAIYLRN